MGLRVSELKRMSSSDVEKMLEAEFEQLNPDMRKRFNNRVDQCSECHYIFCNLGLNDVEPSHKDYHKFELYILKELLGELDLDGDLRKRRN